MSSSARTRPAGFSRRSRTLSQIVRTLRHRILPDGDIYFLVNNSTEPVTGDFAFRASGKAEVWNPLTGETSPAESSKKNGMTTLKLTLPARSGRFVVFGSKGRG